MSISAFIFPSLLQEYSMMGLFSNRIPFAGFIFVIDELIALLGLLCSFFYLLYKGEISSKILKSPSTVMFFIYVAFSFALAYYILPDNSRDLILRNRWILINMCYFFIAFILYPKEKKIQSSVKLIVTVLFFISVLKIIMFIFLRSSSSLYEVSPDFSFFISLSLLVILINSKKVMDRIAYFICAFLIAFISTQLSAIVFFFICVFFGSIATSSNQRLYLRYFKLTLLYSLAGYALISNISFLYQFIIESGFNILFFSDAYIKIEQYLRIWTSAINSVINKNMLTGLGIGSEIEYIAPSFIFLGDQVFKLSLAHNIIVTIIHKFGLIGLILFFFSVREPLLISSNRLGNNYLLLTIKFLIIALFLNFLTTPGIWKIRKGVIFWLILGLYYYFKEKHDSNYQFSK